MSRGGTNRTSIPRAPWTSHGNTIDVNSMSGTRTRAFTGSAVERWVTSCETVLPSATSSGAACTSRANSAREASAASAHGSQLVAPTCQSASACCSASKARLGGRPYDAVFRYPPTRVPFATRKGGVHRGMGLGVVATATAGAFRDVPRRRRGSSRRVRLLPNPAWRARIRGVRSASRPRRARRRRRRRSRSRRTRAGAGPSRAAPRRRARP